MGQWTKTERIRFSGSYIHRYYETRPLFSANYVVAIGEPIRDLSVPDDERNKWRWWTVDTNPMDFPAGCENLTLDERKAMALMLSKMM